MSVGDQGAVSGLLSREQVLDELAFLATVEHALIVEYLSVYCALGYDLDAGEGGATTQQCSDAATTASSLAQGEMFHLRGVTLGLLAAGEQPAQMGRAASISSASVADTPLGPPSVPQRQQLVARGQAIASAVDERYTRLAPAVTSSPGVRRRPPQPDAVRHRRPRSGTRRGLRGHPGFPGRPHASRLLARDPPGSCRRVRGPPPGR